MSMPLNDYKSLRESHDLIDVNLDIVGDNMSFNKVIEEVTFVSNIPSHYVLGSIPLILPRFDRNWGDMSREKHLQYNRIFGLDKDKYLSFQKSLHGEEYAIGKVTDHLIQHHGTLLHDLAIHQDRRLGYRGKFLVPRNPHNAGYVEDLNQYGRKLAARPKRTNSSEIKMKNITEEEYELRYGDKTEDLSDRLAISTPSTPSIKKAAPAKELRQLTSEPIPEVSSIRSMSKVSRRLDEELASSVPTKANKSKLIQKISQHQGISDWYVAEKLGNKVLEQIIDLTAEEMDDLDEMLRRNHWDERALIKALLTRGYDLSKIIYVVQTAIMSVDHLMVILICTI